MTLKEYLKQSGVTQTQLAKLVGVDRPRMSRMVRGKLKPPLDTAFEIQRATAGMVRADSWVTKK